MSFIVGGEQACRGWERWTEDEVAFVVQMRSAGHSWEEVARKLGRSVSGVFRRTRPDCLRAFGKGVTIRKSRAGISVRWTDEIIASACSLISDGHSVASAARQIGASRGQLAMALSVRGLSVLSIRGSTRPSIRLLAS